MTGRQPTVRLAGWSLQSMYRYLLTIFIFANRIRSACRYLDLSSSSQISVQRCLAFFIHWFNCSMFRDAPPCLLMCDILSPPVVMMVTWPADTDSSSCVGSTRSMSSSNNYKYNVNIKYICFKVSRFLESLDTRQIYMPIHVLSQATTTTCPQIPIIHFTGSGRVKTRISKTLSMTNICIDLQQGTKCFLSTGAAILQTWPLGIGKRTDPY